MINDFGEGALPTLEELIQKANSSSRGEGAVLHRSMLRETITVTTVISTVSFGYVKMCAVETLEEAIAYCR
ncbi:MAG: hypothetical protein GYB68_19265 [Chloroflexi bacterium]|nr:hypothetical protein [Chloroflexota bacterium]